MSADIFGLGSMSPVAAIIISVALMLFSGFFMTRLTKLLRLPDVTAYILAGMLLGPYCLHLVPENIIAGTDFLSDIALALTDNDLSGFSVSPNWTFFPFMSLVSNIVGGLWALGIFVATAAWIIAAFSWVVSKAIHNSTMQQYSGIVFVWIALGMMLLGSAMAIVKFASTQALF